MSLVVYNWKQGDELDLLYYSRVFGLRLKDLAEDLEVTPLDEAAHLCQLGPCPLQTQLKELADAGKLITTMDVEAQEFAEETQNDLMLCPCPVYTSPLLMALMAHRKECKEGVEILQNSLDALRMLCKFERILFKASTLSSEAKSGVQATRDKFIARILQFSREEGGWHQLLQMNPPPNLETERAFIKENFYTTVNLLRVLEFTILDYLGIPESEQASYAMYAGASLPKSTIIKAASWKSILLWYKDSYGKMCGPNIEKSCSMSSNRFIPSAVINAVFVATKLALTKSFVYPCSNSDCKKHEAPSEVRFARCSRCRWVRYCSTQCQNAHWKEHKTRCLKTIDLGLLDKERLLIGSDAPGN